MIRVESVLRPRSYGEICDASLETFRRDAAVYATATLLVDAPLAASLLGLFWAVKALGASHSTMIFPLAAAAAFFTLARPLALGAVAVAARERVERGRAPSLAAAWGTALRSGLAIAFSGIVFWCVSLFAGLFYVLPGLLFGGWCSLAISSAALEGHGAFGAVVRSVSLLKGHATRAIALLMFSSALYAVLAANVFAAVQLLLVLGRTFLGLDTAYHEAVLSPGNGLFAMAVLLAVHVVIDPWKACAFYHLHLDARIRHEALDLRQAIERLGSSAPPDEPDEGGPPSPLRAGFEGAEVAAGAGAATGSAPAAGVVASVALALALVLAGAAPAAARPDDGRAAKPAPTTTSAGAPRDAVKVDAALEHAEHELEGYLRGEDETSWDEADRRLRRERIARSLGEVDEPWVDEPLRGLGGGAVRDEAAYQDAAERTLERVRAAQGEVRRASGRTARPATGASSGASSGRRAGASSGGSTARSAGGSTGRSAGGSSGRSAGASSGRSTGRSSGAASSDAGDRADPSRRAARPPIRSPDEARTVVRGVLAERQFQEHLSPEPDEGGAIVGETLGSWWQRIENAAYRWWNEKPEDEGWFFEWLRGIFGPIGGTLMELPWRVISIVILVVAAAVLVWLASRYLRAPSLFGGARAGSLGANPLIADAMRHGASHFRREGDRLFERGDLRGAVRAYYVGILSALHHRRLLKLEPAQTNWEHAARLKGRPDLHSRVVPATRTFDYVWYGRLEVDRERVAMVAGALDEIVGSGAPPEGEEGAKA